MSDSINKILRIWNRDIKSFRYYVAVETVILAVFGKDFSIFTCEKFF